jgi:hypothetical protein
VKIQILGLVALAACVAGHSLFGQAERRGEFEGIEWIRNTSGNSFDFSWTGKPDRYYFVEQSPDLSTDSWSFFPYATKGDGSEAGISLSLSADKFFFRLRYTDDTDSPLLRADFNQSGFSNRDQLDMGTDPFGTTDTDQDGIPDDIEAFWVQVDQAWKLAIVNDPNANFYDPDNLIDSVAGILPGDDYDGDGHSNLREYLDGSDPADFFNGEPALIRAFAGDSQTATLGTLMADPLIVSVTSPTGAEWSGPPIRLVVNEGHDGLVPDTGSPARYDALLLTHSLSGTSVRFEARSTIGTSTVTASLPNGESLTFTLYTVDSSAKARQGVTNFSAVENGDGTTTYSWEAGPADGDFFKLQTRQANGTWLVFYETSYGSTELPFTPGQTEFSLTVASQ